MQKSTPKVLRVILVAIFIYLAVMYIMMLISPISNLLSIESRKLWPSAFNPVARFVANIDWDTRKVTFDSSISKAFNDEIESYIWRIDDGTGQLGESTLEHTFEQPGYYTVQLSIIDKNYQSDVATCHILFPASEVIVEGDTVKPKGTFFNYSKLFSNSQSDLSNKLTSNFVDTNCGLSNRGYNITGVYSNLTERNASLRSSAIEIFEYTATALVVVVLFLVFNTKLKKLEKVK